MHVKSNRCLSNQNFPYRISHLQLRLRREQVEDRKLNIFSENQGERYGCVFFSSIFFFILRTTIAGGVGECDIQY